MQADFNTIPDMQLNLPEPSADALAASRALRDLIAADIRRNAGWIPFTRYMELALYAPGLGYYANETAKFGALPESGSDFVTAPEISPIFGQLVAAQLAEALDRTDTREIWEFGAGTGALALQILDELAARGRLPARYTIVDLSGTLRARQQLKLARYEHLLRWVDAALRKKADSAAGAP